MGVHVLPEDRIAANERHLTPTDVLLVSYPRSGNTWLRQMISDLYFQALGFDTSDPAFLIENFATVSPALEEDDLAHVRRPPLGFLVLKTHAAALATRHRFVYVWRDPVDAIVSYWRLLQRRPITYMEPGLERFGRKQAMAWRRHAETVIDHAQQGRFVAYADLLAAPEECLQQCADFIGLAPSTGQIARAVAHNTADIQRQRFLTVGGTALADYSIASACVGGNLELVSPELRAHVRRVAREPMRALAKLSIRPRRSLAARVATLSRWLPLRQWRRA